MQSRSGILGVAVAVAFVLAVAPASAQSESAAALVEDIENAPDAGVSFLDYVYPGQVIELGAAGTIVLSYFVSCRIETVTGGRLEVTREASIVSGGRLSQKSAPCQYDQAMITAATGEAGAGVTRIPDDAIFDEWTVKATRPIFKWSRAGDATVVVFDLDADPDTPVWTARVTGSHIDYPADAPPLEVGPPYQVRVTIGGETLSADFSINPDLGGPDTVASRVVPVGR